MDTLFLRALTVRCRIGVYPWEQRSLRPLTLDLELLGDFSAAGRSDNLADTLNYAELADRVRALAASRPFALIEHLAESVATLALDYPQPMAVRVTVSKRGAVPEAESVGICLYRERSGA